MGGMTVGSLLAAQWLRHRELPNPIRAFGVLELIIGISGTMMQPGFRVLEQIDSSGLNVFVHLLKRIRPDGGRIVFFGLNRNIKRVFEITKLGTVMKVVDSRDDALEACKG